MSSPQRRRHLVLGKLVLGVRARRLRALVAAASVVLVGWMLLIVGLPCVADPVGDVQTSGFGLFKCRTPAWSWDPVPLSRPIASVETSGEVSRVRFRIPITAIGDADPPRVRVGIVSGSVGTQPRCWVTAGHPLRASDQDAALGADDTLAGAALRSAAISFGDSCLIVDLDFDATPHFRGPWDLYLLLDTDGDPSDGFGGAEYLVQNTLLRVEAAREGIEIPWLTAQPAIGKVGGTAELTGIVTNRTSEDLRSVRVDLALPRGVGLIAGSAEQVVDIRAGDSARLVWRLALVGPGTFRAKVTAERSGCAATAVGWVTAVVGRDPRHEFQTAAGAWLRYPARPTLQAGNASPVRDYRSLSSSRLKRNLFGITAHLTRSTNQEDPFAASNAVDRDARTCWASRWWRTESPLDPEWLRLDLGRTRSVREVRFLPAWNNSGMPHAFRIETSVDGEVWETAVDAVGYRPQQAPPGSRLRVGVLSWQLFTFASRPARYVRLSATQLGQGSAFFCCPTDPFQFRLAEVRILDGAGAAIPLDQKRVRASSTHTAWYNSPDTIRKTWPLLLKSGVKLNRIGQWGDKVDWASVERVKGVYRVDPEADGAVTESVRAGVDILMTLGYGNDLYQKLPDPQDVGPTWERGHPFRQSAPTTDEAVRGFAAYCAFMATHFRGRVKYFEIWNEEDGWFFDSVAGNDGSIRLIRLYGRALAAAAKAIKRVNPEARVVFGGIAGSSLDFPRIALEEGAGPYVDIVAFHPYGHATPEAAPGGMLSVKDGRESWQPTPPEITSYETEIAAYRRTLRVFNPRMEIWADEMNWFAPGEPPMASYGDQSELAQAKYLARFYSLNAWLGCGSIWWSLFNANHIQEWAVVRSSDLSPRAAYYSAGAVATALDDVTGVSDLRTVVVGDAPADLMVKVYRCRGDTIVGLWRTSAPRDDCRPVPVNLDVGAHGVRSVSLIDSLYGATQSGLVGAGRDGVVRLSGLLVGDWPLFVRLASR